MIKAEDLYKKIKAKYPDFRAPKAVGEENFECNPQPPLTSRQLKLLEMGFPVKPNYDPFLNEESREFTRKLVDNILKQMRRDRQNNDQIGNRSKSVHKVNNESEKQSRQSLVGIADDQS